MSYARFTVMYGIPLHGNDPRSADVEDLIENLEGMYCPYSGSADESPAAFGVKLDDFDECSPYIDLAQLNLVPSPAQLKEFQKVWDALETEEKELLAQFGEPRVFFLASTS
jgi:hypothetical protein